MIDLTCYKLYKQTDDPSLQLKLDLLQQQQVKKSFKKNL